MNKLGLVVFSLIIFSVTARSQFYYNDLLVNRQNLEKHQLYKQLKVTKILAKSSSDIEAPGIEPLTVEQWYNNGYTQLKSRTSTNLSRTSMTNYYNGQGQLYRTVDSSDNAITTYEYQYQDNRLVVVNSSSVPPGEKQKTVEIHNWIYDSLGRPEKMIRIREGDTLELRFTTDDKGLVSQEQVYRKGSAGDKVYYYYDAQGQLSDVVRYQDKLGKLIPDYTFDRDGDGRISAMMVVQNGGKDYINWRYEYNGNGLLTKESCYDKQKKLVGKVEYSYEMKK